MKMLKKITKNVNNQLLTLDLTISSYEIHCSNEIRADGQQTSKTVQDSVIPPGPLHVFGLNSLFYFNLHSVHLDKPNRISSTFFCLIFDMFLIPWSLNNGNLDPSSSPYLSFVGQVSHLQSNSWQTPVIKTDP
jgi:hypothetical protein